MRFAGFLRKTASKSTEHFKHAACVVKGGRVLAVGYNHGKIHAEADAIRGVSSAEGCVLYVVRIKKDGKFMMSRPCNNCMNLAIRRGIKKIVYSISDNEYGIINVRFLEELPPCY